MSFFNRISLVNAKTKERLLPIFFSDNYISIVPCEEKEITFSYDELPTTNAVIEIEGWNTPKQTLKID